MKDFFFDTANIEFIKNIMNRYELHINPQWVRGITTNPNAFSKVNLHHLDEWFEHTAVMAKLISDIRGDDNGEIHIQAPFSHLEPKVILEYAKMISGLTEGKCRVGMKIPPYEQALKYVDEFNQYVLTNVTGVADSATALKCITYNIDYVSIIPGRMEEVGIDAITAIAYVNQANFESTEIITGSQRTTEQIIYSFYLNTVPTIGEKCWDDIAQGDNFNRILTNKESYQPVGPFSPTISQENINLSLAFFEQMDKLGDIARKDLEAKLAV
jgi:transaldolase